MPKSLTLRERLVPFVDTVLNGTILAIDPASICLGYAVLEKGEILVSGDKTHKGAIHSRLVGVYSTIKKLREEYNPELLIIEQLRSNSKHKTYSPPPLLWSIGVTIAAAKVPVIEVSPKTHQVYSRRKDWPKTDENDAKAMAFIVHELCQELK